MVKNESKYALPCLYAPIVQITMFTQDNLTIKSIPEKYIVEEIKNNYLELEKYLDKQVKITTPHNIKCVTGYYYDYHWSRTWSNELPTETIPVNHIDFQAQWENSHSCHAGMAGK